MAYYHIYFAWIQYSVIYNAVFLYPNVEMYGSWSNDVRAFYALLRSLRATKYEALWKWKMCEMKD